MLLLCAFNFFCVFFVEVSLEKKGVPVWLGILRCQTFHFHLHPWDCLLRRFPLQSPWVGETRFGRDGRDGRDGIIKILVCWLVGWLVGWFVCLFVCLFVVMSPFSGSLHGKLDGIF